jgi:hypothetical protein
VFSPPSLSQLRETGDIAKAEEIEELLRQYPDAEEVAPKAALPSEDKVITDPKHETSMIDEAMATVAKVPTHPRDCACE